MARVKFCWKSHHPHECAHGEKPTKAVSTPAPLGQNAEGSPNPSPVSVPSVQREVVDFALGDSPSIPSSPMPEQRAAAPTIDIPAPPTQAAKAAENADAAEEGLVQIFGALGSVVNGMVDDSPQQMEKPQWTRQHSEMLAKGTIALDGKYHFLGKMGDYAPELLMAGAVINVTMLLIQVTKYRQAHMRPKGASQYEQQESEAQRLAAKKRELETLASQYRASGQAGTVDVA